MAAPASTTAPASAVEHVAEVPKQTEPKVYIGNLNYKTTEEDVRNFVAGAGGKISSVVVPLKYGKRPAGFAIVAYESQSDAEAVVEKLQDSELDGRKLKIQLSRSDEERDAARAKRDAARDAKRAADKKKKQEAAAAAAPASETAPVEGEAVKEKKTKKRTSRRRVPGEEGEEEEAAEGETTDAAAVTETKSKSKRKPKKAPAAAEARIDGEAEATEAEAKKPREKKERKPREKSLVPTGEDSKDTLFVSNLPYDLTDDSLAAIFTNLSIEVKSAKIIRQVRGVYRGKKENAKTVNTEPRSKGFGFVEIANPAQRDEAVEKAAGTLIQTREIGVKVAKEMVKVEKQKNEGGAGAAVGQAPDQDESNIQATPEKATA